MLTQPEEGADATFRYYKDPPHEPSAVPTGAIILNREARRRRPPPSPPPFAACSADASQRPCARTRSQGRGGPQP